MTLDITIRPPKPEEMERDERAPILPGIGQMPEQAEQAPTSIVGQAPTPRANIEGYGLEGTAGTMAASLQGAASGLAGAILWLPDAILNIAIKGAEAAGILPEGSNRDLLNRLVNAGDYETVNYVLGFLPQGQGEDAGFQTVGGRIGHTGGEMAGIGLGIAGLARGVGKQAVKQGATATSAEFVPMGTQSQQAVRQGERAAVIRQTQTGRATSDPREVLRTFGRETYMAPGLSNVKALAGREMGLGALGGTIYQGAEEIVPGSGPYAIMAPPSIPLLWKATKFAVGGTWRAFRGVPSLIRFASEQPEVQGAVEGIKRRGRDFRESISGTPTQRRNRSRTKVQQRIDTELERAESIVNMSRTEEIQLELEAQGQRLKLSPAEESLNPSLGREQARIEAGMTGENTAKNLGRKSENIANLLSYGERLFATEGIEDVSATHIIDTATGRFTRLKAPAVEELEIATETLAQVSHPKAGELPALESLRPGGLSIRRQIVTDRKRAIQDSETLAVEIGIRDIDSMGEISIIKDRFWERIGVEDGSISADGFHPIIRRFLTKDFKDGLMTFRDWKSFRSQVSSAHASELQRNPASARELGEFKAALDDMMFTQTELSSNYKTWANSYYETVIKPFESRAIMRITARPGGRPEINGEYEYIKPDEAVAKSFFTDSNAMDVFMERFAGNQKYNI